MPNPIPVTTLITGVLAVVQVPLTILVSYMRGRTGIQFLDGGNETLLRRIRAHGNFVEASSAVLWRGGICLLLGRAIHVFAALSVKGWGVPRVIAMVLTFYAMAGFGIACLRASFP